MRIVTPLVNNVKHDYHDARMASQFQCRRDREVLPVAGEELLKKD
jgi:hypothetical protein